MKDWHREHVGDVERVFFDQHNGRIIVSTMHSNTLASLDHRDGHIGVLLFANICVCVLMSLL